MNDLFAPPVAVQQALNQAIARQRENPTVQSEIETLDTMIAYFQQSILTYQVLRRQAKLRRIYLKSIRRLRFRRRD